MTADQPVSDPASLEYNISCMPTAIARRQLKLEQNKLSLPGLLLLCSYNVNHITPAGILLNRREVM
jgi:hypothetical protein